ncbi:unnamed protein product, partial [Ectocarpus sp. 4 AP-2014]
MHPFFITWFAQSAVRRGGRNRTATVPGKMPTGADKKDQDHDHWRKREAVWAGWGDQEAYDKKMAETKEKRDAAREVHEANQKKRQEELEAASSTPHVTERQEKGSDGNGEDDMEISDGVYYKRAELRNLQYYYDKSYAFDPKNIGVVLGETGVKIDGRIHVVKSVDHGKYTLKGRESTLTQWELLENRCDEGVTLNTDLRRFILHLVTKYSVMMGSVVPALSGVLTGMLWNPNDAIDRANRSGEDTDPASNMKTSELMSIKVRVDTLRDLSLAVFTKIPMEATLGANFWSDRHDESLKDFAAQPGSLSQLNFLGGLGCVADDDLV